MSKIRDALFSSMFSSARVVLLAPLARELGLTVIALVVHNLMASYLYLSALITQNSLMRAICLSMILQLSLMDNFSALVDAGGPSLFTFALNVVFKLTDR